MLIDVGRSAKQIEEAMMQNELDMRSVRAIFITHEHIDHCRGLRVLASRYGINVYASEGTLEELIKGGHIDDRFSADVISDRLTVGDMLIERVNTPHDSRESCAYRVTTADSKRAMVATDMGVMLPSVRNYLSRCDVAVIESNHDIDMLRTGPYPYLLRRRILSDRGHLSNVACAKELPDLVRSGLRRILLGHLSSENNTPQLALATSLKALESAGLRHDDDFVLDVAPKETNGKAILY